MDYKPDQGTLVTPRRCLCGRLAHNIVIYVAKRIYNDGMLAPSQNINNVTSKFNSLCVTS